MVKQKKLLLRCFDDSVIILAFILDDGHFVKREGTKEEIELEILKAATAFPERCPILSWEEIMAADLPDREYRNAWMTKGKKIEHDMVKAREIHREKLRVWRAPLLDQLDVDYMRADEAGDNDLKKKIAAMKQALRDVTKNPAIEQAETVEELKVI